MTTRDYASADDIIRALVEDLDDITLAISHPEPGLVLCDLTRPSGTVGYLRIEAYDDFASFALTDLNRDDVLLGEAFYGQPAAAQQNIDFLKTTISGMPKPGAAPGLNGRY